MANITGFDSNWNEAMFKMMRLHDCQNLINFYKRDLSARDGKRFNYENLFIELNNLFFEGNSKYTDKEREEVDRIKRAIEYLFRFKPGHLAVKDGRMGKEKTVYRFDSKNYDNLIKWLEEYEYKIKYYNDKHGLSTSNKQERGFFG